MRNQDYKNNFAILKSAYFEANKLWRQLQKIDRKSFLEKQHDSILLDMNEFFMVNKKLNKFKSNFNIFPLTADEFTILRNYSGKIILKFVIIFF